MAGAPDDPTADQPVDSEQEEPIRPQGQFQSVAWPQTGHMPDHNLAAQRTFERNSNLLQRAAAAGPPEDSVRHQAPENELETLLGETGPKRDYNRLKADQAELTFRDNPDRQKRTVGLTEGEADRNGEQTRGSFQRLKAEQAGASRSDSRDGEPTNSPESKEHSGRGGDELTFLSDRSSPDRSRGR